MTSVELKERFTKALEKVEKCKATIERHKKQAEKKLQIIKANGWEDGILDDSCYRGSNYIYEALSALSDYEWKLDDISGAERKLAEAEQVADNWAKKYKEALQRELTIATEVPEAFKQAREALVKSWVEQDILEREVMLQKRKDLPYKEFRQLYRYTEEEALNHTDEEFRKMEEREADMWLLDLYNRVKAITGEVTDCSNIYWGGKCLDGYIVGKNGRARVDTIEAGGYNIQRWHLRVLVHKM